MATAKKRKVDDDAAWRNRIEAQLHVLDLVVVGISVTLSQPMRAKIADVLEEKLAQHADRIKDRGLKAAVKREARIAITSLRLDPRKRSNDAQGT